MLLSMAGNVTFAEFLGFMANGNDTTSLIQEGARRIDRMTKGVEDPIVTNWFTSDHVL